MFLGASTGDKHLVSKESETVSFDSKNISAASTGELHVDTSDSPTTTARELSPIIPRSKFSFPKSLMVLVSVPFYEKKLFYYTNAPDEYGVTQLHCAALEGKIDTVIALLEDKETFVNPVDINGATSGSLEILKKLIARGACINRQMYDSDQSVLHMAALSGRLDILQELLKIQGLDVNIQDMNKRTALHFAVFSSDEVTVKKLLEESSINVNIKDEEQLTASDYAQTDSMKELFISHGIEKKS